MNGGDCADLGLTRANIYAVLDRGLSSKRLDELSMSVNEAIKQLTGVS